MIKCAIKRFQLGRLKIKYELRSSDPPWGRFGGGWNWAAGFQVGSKTVILNCLIFTLRFELVERQS